MPDLYRDLPKKRIPFLSCLHNHHGISVTLCIYCGKKPPAQKSVGADDSYVIYFHYVSYASLLLTTLDAHIPHSRQDKWRELESSK